MVDYSVNAQVNPQDITADPKYYARLQVNRTLDMMAFAEHISSHLGKYSPHEINAVLGGAVSCMRELLLDGRQIELGDLGSFKLTASSIGTATAEQFTPSRIYKLSVLWRPGKKFNNLLSVAKFNLVPTRSAQKAVLAAEKKGNTTVTL